MDLDKGFFRHLAEGAEPLGRAHGQALKKMADDVINTMLVLSSSLKACFEKRGNKIILLCC